MLVMVENYDSFSFNMVQDFAKIGKQVKVVANDAVNIAQVRASEADILLSAGPCDPNKAGKTLEVIDQCHTEQKMLGICLGHQAIGQYFGGKIVQAHKPVHGKVTDIYHTGEGIFANLPNPLKEVRYNSLIIEKKSLPKTLKITAWTQTKDGKVDEIMAIEHVNLPIYGIQFHPESIASEKSLEIFQNWLDINQDSAN